MIEIQCPQAKRNLSSHASTTGQLLKYLNGTNAVIKCAKLFKDYKFTLTLRTMSQYAEVCSNLTKRGL